MTRGDLCAVLYGFAPVTTAQLSHLARVLAEEIDAFYRVLCECGLVDIDRETERWFRLLDIPLADFQARVAALGVNLREPLGLGSAQPRR